MSSPRDQNGLNTVPEAARLAGNTWHTSSRHTASPKELIGWNEVKYNMPQPPPPFSLSLSLSLQSFIQVLHPLISFQGHVGPADCPSMHLVEEQAKSRHSTDAQSYLQAMQSLRSTWSWEESCTSEARENPGSVCSQTTEMQRFRYGVASHVAF